MSEQTIANHGEMHRRLSLPVATIACSQRTREDGGQPRA
jgi:hypothetical protein